MKSKSTATVLCFFLGGFGAHKFYLGQSGIGIVYLLFFWTCIPGLIALVEFFILLSMDKKTFDMRYNQGVSQIGNADELAKLYELKEKGAITPEEFYEKKKLLL
ncbi:MAG TPA: hypothetical protein DCX97_08870 [Alistipes sp.]|nr:hypothetical protein [Alistipes sp.]